MSFEVLAAISTNVDTGVLAESLNWKFTDQLAHELLAEAHEFLSTAETRSDLGHEGKTFSRHIGAMIGDVFNHPVGKKTTQANLDDHCYNILKEFDENDEKNLSAVFATRFNVHERLHAPLAQYLHNQGYIRVNWDVEDENGVQDSRLPTDICITGSGVQFMEDYVNGRREFNREQKKKAMAQEAKPERKPWRGRAYRGRRAHKHEGGGHKHKGGRAHRSTAQSPFRVQQKKAEPVAFVPLPAGTKWGDISSD
jgi:hypothetical protein